MAYIAASVLAKLKNKAKAPGISIQIIAQIKNDRVPFNVDMVLGMLSFHEPMNAKSIHSFKPLKLLSL